MLRSVSRGTVMLAGVQHELVVSLRTLLPDLSILRTNNWSNVHKSARLDLRLLVVHQALGEEQLRELRLSAPQVAIFLIVGDDPAAAVELVRRAVVSRLLVAGFDAHELGVHIARQLGVRLQPQPAAPALPTALAQQWERFRGVQLGRVGTLEGVWRTLVTGDPLSDFRRRQALEEANRLIGSLGSFGLTGATLHAREACSLLGSGDYSTARLDRLIELIVQLRQAIERGVESPLAEPGGERSLGVRVLAVDDDPISLASLSATLGPMGIEVEGLRDPMLFWERLETVAPDLVMLDVEMPILWGLDLCRSLRRDPRWQDRPVLFLTSYTDRETMQRIYACGADDYVSKPIVGGELAARVLNRLTRLGRVPDIDSLTNLPLRRRATEDLHRLLALARRQNAPLTLAWLDVDRMHELNDSLGHDRGDAALKRCAEVLAQEFGREDLLVRWGGEEFMVGVFGLEPAAVQAALERCLSALHPLSFSGGMACFPEDGAEFDTLLKVAETMLHQAKWLGRTRVIRTAGVALR